MRSILLDTGVLWLVTQTGNALQAEKCRSWMEHLLGEQEEFVIPEICDYELRRWLLRRDKRRSIQRLDQLAKEVTYLPLDTETMRRAAVLWSDLRRQHQQTASDESLDADVILGAQAKECEVRGASVIVATTNVKHLRRMCAAEKWQDIG